MCISSRAASACELSKCMWPADNDHIQPESITTVKQLGEGAFATGKLGLHMFSCRAMHPTA